MYEIKPETLAAAHKPLDIVTNEHGAVGLIQEVSVNECQEDPQHQVKYAVKWVIEGPPKHAWFRHEELNSHGSLPIILGEMACSQEGCNADYVGPLFRAPVHTDDLARLKHLEEQFNSLRDLVLGTTGGGS